MDNKFFSIPSQFIKLSYASVKIMYLNSFNYLSKEYCHITLPPSKNIFRSTATSAKNQFAQRVYSLYQLPLLDHQIDNTLFALP